nr:uncharacterized protein LOC128698514 isoform X1 [Cherax quadricarinatus]
MRLSTMGFVSAESRWLPRREQAEKGKIWAVKVLSPSETERRLRQRFDEAFELCENEKMLLWPFKQELETKSLFLVPETPHKASFPNIFRRSLRPLRMCLRVLSILPFTYNVSRGQYVMKWCTFAFLQSVITAIYLTVLMVTIVVGGVTMFSQSEIHQTQENITIFDIKMLVVLLIGGNLMNAWVQVLSLLYGGQRVCGLLNSWNSLVAATHLDPLKGLQVTMRMQIGLLCGFCVIVLTLSFMEAPDVLVWGLDGVAQTILLVPEEWFYQSPAFVKVVRVVTCVVCLHLFSVFKSFLFSFIINCHMLKNGLASWNHQLSDALEAMWRVGGRRRGHLGMLVQSHFQLVRLVRETEEIFGPMLQCYYGSTVVILCTELYLLAYRLGCSIYSADGVVTIALMTLQTAAVFTMVSLSAAAIEEVANDSIDILRRGIPFNTSNRDKFNMEELTMALTRSPIYITGGKFFVINRPFIITVMSAVITYFIVMIQFMQPCQDQADTNNTQLLGSTQEDFS